MDELIKNAKKELSALKLGLMYHGVSSDFLNKDIKFIPKTIDKLASIIELEQQLGIDIVTLFGLIGKDVYCIADSKVLCGESIENTLYKNVRKFTISYLYSSGIRCEGYVIEDWYEWELSELGSRWFLTEIEAQEALEGLEE